MPKSGKRALKSKKRAILLGMALLICYCFFEPYWIEEKQVVIENEQVPPAFDGKRLVFLTDIHHGPFFSLDRVRTLTARVNDMKPDLILLGGDYVHRDPRYIEPCFEELSKLRALMGVYGVLGNHDHWESKVRTEIAMKKAGIAGLDNQGVWIQQGVDRIRLGGVGDMFEDVQNQAATLDEASIQDFVILMSHSPDFFPEANRKKVDVMLSGHTHGGQMTLFGLWAPLIPSKYGNTYRSGVFKADGSTLIVSNGIGTITPPVRFFARPQIIVVTLRHRPPATN